MADPFSVAGLAIASNRGTVRNYITANTAADNAIQVNGSIRDVDFKKFWRGLSRIEKRPSERDESIGDPRIFVYEGREPRTAKPAVDIVAVHGFGADANETWEEANGCVWLRDLLPSDIPEARIMSYSYSVDKISSGNVASSAEGLLQALVEMRQGKERGKRPIIFICHSLGGNLVQQALAMTEEKYIYESILKSTRGILFFGTPQKASRIAAPEKLFKASNIPSSQYGNRLLLDTLKEAARYHAGFLKFLGKSKGNIRVVSFYETKPTVDRASGSAYCAVSREEAILKIPGEICHPIDTDHAGLCKFDARDNERYLLALDELAKLSGGWNVANNTVRETAILPELESIPVYLPQQVPYELESIPYDEGAHGVVHEATGPTGDTVAIKVIRNVYGEDKRQKVLNEIRMLRKSSHPNVLKLLDAYKIDGSENIFYLVTWPWAPRTLSNFINEGDVGRANIYPWYIQGDPVSEVYAYRIFQGLVSGLSHIHGCEVKHKDIKPENILLSFDEGRGESIRWVITPIIADLGLSKDISSMSKSNFTDSTRKYLAPEQLSHTKSTVEADVFALGCCFAQVLGVLHGGSAGFRKIEEVVHDKQYGGEFGKAWRVVQDLLDTFDVRDTTVRGDVISCVKSMLDGDLVIRPDMKKVEELLRDCDLRVLVPEGN